MEVVSKILLVGLGGAIGANLRYWVGGWILNLMSKPGSNPTAPHFPWETLVINATGSLIIGFFLGLALQLNWSLNSRLFVATGILGGYTTFSTFAYEAVGLLTSREYGKALLYIEGSALFTVFGAWLGLVLARVVLGGRI